MRSTLFEPVELRTADVLVIGHGVAGLMAALHARGREVLLVGVVAQATAMTQLGSPCPNRISSSVEISGAA